MERKVRGKLGALTTDNQHEMITLGNILNIKDRERARSKMTQVIELSGCENASVFPQK